ncbi:MAG: hypothetical protein OXQ96_00480 [Alphaproteobacteria bacterium]|nr:hypothetical protein [Alphaproteobacteria bacterium]
MPAYAADMADVVTPISPVPSIEPPMERATDIERIFPPDYKPKPIEQRIEALTKDSFIILPKESPLPNGTISRDMLKPEEEVQEAVAEQPVRRKPDMVESTQIEKPKLKAKLVELPDGRAAIHLQGLSQGGQIFPHRLRVASAEQVQKKQQDTQPEVKKVQQQVKPKPKVEVYKVKLDYFADQISPESQASLNDIIQKVKGKDVREVVVTNQYTPLPMGMLENLPDLRWQRVSEVFNTAGVQFREEKTQLSQIMLIHADHQFLEVELQVQ